MSRFALWRLLFVVTVFWLAACAPVARGPLKVMELDSGSLLELRVGAQFVVTLNANPSTGYVWEIAPPGIAAVRPQGEPQFSADTRARDGSGTVTWPFEAVAAGEGSLRMVYHRPDEAGATPLRSFELFLIVK
jgi:inhibitor of cysteine peptidase